MSQIYNIYNNLNVVGSSQTFSLSSTSITGGTLYGNIDAKYIGTGQTGTIPNLVTNTEFSYLSGLTGNVQTQINNKVNVNAPLITFSGTPSLTNQRLFSGGTNIVTGITNNNFTISARIQSLEVGTIEVTTGGDVNYSLSDFNPNGWSEEYPNRATQIVINPLNVIKIGGLSGASQGRFTTITNNGPYLIILENLSTGSTSLNRFKFQNNRTFYLSPKKTISLIHDGDNWVSLSPLANNGLDVFDDMYSFPGFQAGGAEYNITSVPFQGVQFYVDGINGTMSSSSGIAFRGEGDVSTGAMRMSPCLVLNNVANSRVRIGLGRGYNNFLTQSGSSSLYVTSVNFRNGALTSPTDNRGVTIGFENSYLQNSFSAATNNGTTIGQFSGGSFWYYDYSSNTQYFKYVVQNTGNTIISAVTSTLNINSYGGVLTYLDYGIYFLCGSGNTPSSSTFFWRDLSTGNLTIEPPVIIYENTIQGIPGNNMYSGYLNTYSVANRNGTTNMYIDFIGMTYTQNCFS